MQKMVHWGSASTTAFKTWCIQTSSIFRGSMTFWISSREPILFHFGLASRLAGPSRLGLREKNIKDYMSLTLCLLWAEECSCCFLALMQWELMGLNPERGPYFVSVYRDNVVFPPTFEDNLWHLKLVIERLLEAGLKLKPSKCHFLCQLVEFWGHLNTPKGISLNPS